MHQHVSFEHTKDIGIDNIELVDLTWALTPIAVKTR